MIKKNFIYLVLFFCAHAHANTIYERPLVVVVPSYNNELWYTKNLDSIFAQNYSNYRVIYIDDCSPDSTGYYVKKYTQEYGQSHRVKTITNTEWQGALANHFKAVHMCEDNEIIVQLDGDDWFAHDDVLARINQEYADSNVWMTYGQYQIYPSGKVGQCKLIPPGVLKKCAYREYSWVTSALRTFYAGLFKKIKLQDLVHEGSFFKASCDLACMLPMLEMAEGKVKFIDEILYIYNCKTQFNDHKKNLQLQRHTEYVIRGRKKYNPLSSLIFKQKNSSDLLADVIIFSQNNPDQLSEALHNFYVNTSGYGVVTVLYEGNNKTICDKYTALSDTFPEAHIINANIDLKKILTTLMRNIPNNYTMLTFDTSVFKKNISLAMCVKSLKSTNAHAFLLSLGKNVTQSKFLDRMQQQPLFIDLPENISAWQFKDGEYSWATSHSMDMALYTKKNIYLAARDMRYDSIDQFKYAWSQYPVDSDSMGLCFSNAIE